jgi:transcriptional regulator with XRE-family HTH domain
MDGLGKRMKARAQALMLTDTEVARRLGISQNRYANYVTDSREPDYLTLVRICGVLATTPNHLLGLEEAPTEDGEATLARRIEAATNAMDGEARRIAAEVMDTLVRALQI